MSLPTDESTDEQRIDDEPQRTLEQHRPDRTRSRRNSNGDEMRRSPDHDPLPSPLTPWFDATWTHRGHFRNAGAQSSQLSESLA